MSVCVPAVAASSLNLPKVVECRRVSVPDIIEVKNGPRHAFFLDDDDTKHIFSFTRGNHIAKKSVLHPSFFSC